MSDDATLLRRYVTEGSEAAFAELVRRHVDLVHSAALRQVGGDLHRAQDVTQAVFCELARKAPRLMSHRALSGWLYTTARFIGARLQRAETRRLVRERTSHAMSETLTQSATESLWNELGPVLDEAMGALGERDRTAIVLRFFEDKPLAEVGFGLGLRENAARMRVDRALERLRGVLAKRGIKSTTSVLGAALVANAILPAPVGVASALIGPAIASAVVSATTIPGMTLSLLHIMNSTKIAVGVCALAMTGVVGTYVGMNHANAKLRIEVAALQNQAAAPTRLGAENPAGVDSPTDHVELARLRAEHSELSRLRGEMGVLHQNQVELSQLRAEKAQRDQLDVAKAAEEQARKANEEIGIAKLNFAKQWFLAFRDFAQENGGKIPATFEQAAKYFPQSAQPGAPFLSSDDFEIVFKGSLADISVPSRAIIAREKQAYNVQPSGEALRTYLFADGHSEIHNAHDGNFQPWEQERMVQPMQNEEAN